MQVAESVNGRPIALTLPNFGTFSNVNFVRNRVAMMGAKGLYFSGFRGSIS